MSYTLKVFIVFPMSLLLNLHTHHPLYSGEATIHTAGLHPWHVTQEWHKVLASLDMIGTDAVGECGLDRLCDTPYELQKEAFRAQIELSESLHKPLILHCVRAMDDVLLLKRTTRQPWVWHGFRGKPAQLHQLLHHGFYISFAFRYNEESLRQCPVDRLFLETDDINMPIAPLYTKVAAHLGITEECLCQHLWKNLHHLVGMKT